MLGEETILSPITSLISDICPSPFKCSSPPGELSHGLGELTPSELHMSGRLQVP